jgi:cephalosporin hydroxylase
MITIKEVEAMGSDSQLVFGGTFEGGIHLQQLPDEIVPCLNDILKSNKQILSILEIGAAAGGSTYLFNHVFKPKTIVIIDDNKHPKHIFRTAIIKKIQGKVKEYIGSSQTTEAISFIKDLKMKFDIIIVDGGHSFFEVMTDVENYKPFLEERGYLFLHDIEVFDYVKRIFEQLKNSGKYKTAKTYISKTHQNPCGIGLLQKRSKND